MSKRDFELIARTIEQLGPCSYRTRVAIDFSKMLGREHPRFKRRLFLFACGVHPAHIE